MTFRDGSPMSAEDLKFTLDRISLDGAMGNGQTSPRKGLMGPVQSVALTAPDTVRITLSEPWPLMPAMLPFREVVSKAFTRTVGPEGLATQAMGSGPFRLVEWRKGDSIIMERFAGCNGGATGIPPAGPACVAEALASLPTRAGIRTRSRSARARS